jgi:transposase
MPRPKGSADLLEERRRRALALLDSGFYLNEVGRRVGCNASSVMRWRDARRRGGDKALQVRISPGRPAKLDGRQRRHLVRLLAEGPKVHGYLTNLWTITRIAEVIRRQFGVEYHRNHVGRLMRSLGWSPQKPARRALERDAIAIAQLKKQDWPSIKKTPRGWAPTTSLPMNRASS